jgi:hypothetical protein
MRQARGRTQESTTAHSMNMKRMRGRSHRGGGGGAPPRHYNGNIPLNRNHVFDSNGPDLRIRGTAQQLFEKYLQLGRDAASGGDRVLAEGYFQHAEHYFRIVGAMNQQQQQQQNHAQHGPNGAQNHGGQNQGNQNPGNQNHGGQHNPQHYSQRNARPVADYGDMPDTDADDPPGLGDQPEGRDAGAPSDA